MDIDWISALPDAVLHRILSFLDMKEVVHTSLLSLRWRDTWVSLPVINCNQSSWRDHQGFSNFITKVLLLRDGSNVRKLQICSQQDLCDTKSIEECITSAARKHLQELHLQLQLSPTAKMEFPRALFSSDVTVLKLDFVRIDESAPHVRIPNSVCLLTRLVTLELVFVKLPEGNSNRELLFSYPVLENLILRDCCYLYHILFKISTPQLKTLVIHNHLQTNISCPIELCAPNLKSIEISCELTGENSILDNFRMKKLSSLVSAKIHFGYALARSIVRLLRGISCAKTIDLSCNQFEDINHFSTELTSLFLNLRCLKLRFRELEMSRVIFMPTKFPYIEKFILLHEDISDIPEDLFADINYHLKQVEIGWLIGNEDAYKCIKSLLKNAMVLEKLVIRMKRDSSAGSENENFGEKLISLPRASSGISILYFS